MTPPWQEISGWPFAVPLAAVVTAVLLLRLRRRDALNVPRTLLVVTVCVYGAGVIASTLFPVFVGKPPSDLPWWETVNVTPFANTDVRDMLQNVVVFLPVGFLVPLLTRVRSLGRVVLAGVLLSLAIETVQLVQAGIGQGGHVADVNDLFANVLGAPLGYAAFLVCLRVPPLARLARAATWPPRRAGATHEHLSAR